MKTTTAVALCLLVGVVVAQEAYKSPTYDKQPEGYFMYANIPGDHEYEFGYNRGNPSHFTSKFEQAKDWKFRTKVKWGDSYEGHGEQYWEYNHGHHHEPAYEAPAAPAYSAPAYSAPAPAYEAPKY